MGDVVKAFEIVTRGDGPPLVLVPGIQGRWEYARGTVEALSRWYRVITFSLCDERSPVRRSTAAPMDAFAGQIDTALNRVGFDCAIVVGVSFGGLAALRFAASRPGRTRALVMVSAPGPEWHLSARHDVYARLPWLFGPAFLAEVPLRVRHEIRTALPDRAARRRFRAGTVRTMFTAPLSLSRMAARARMIATYDRVADAGLVTAPTLIVHGEPALDHVTHAGGTAEYARLIPGARCVQLEGTGHLGSVTQPEACAAVIHHFLRTAIKDTHDSAA